MKLKEDFFRVISTSHTATGIDYKVVFNPEHQIYKSHFPNNPITPGVCIIQIVKELAIEITNHNLFLKKLSSAKFLNVINPLKNEEVTFSIFISLKEDEKYKVDALVYHEHLQFAKLSMLFNKQ